MKSAINTNRSNATDSPTTGRTRLLWSAFIAVYLCGCTSMRPVASAPENLSSALRVDDQVVVRSKSGATHEFVVSRISPDEICGPKECLPFREVGSVERREYSSGKTAWLVTGVTLLAVTALLYVVARSMAPVYSWN